MQIDELSGVAAKIEEGTYEKPVNTSQPNTSKSKPQEQDTSSYTKAQSLDALIGRITGGQYFDIEGFTSNRVSAAAKAALRTHIDMLEELYNSVKISPSSISGST